LKSPFFASAAITNRRSLKPLDVRYFFIRSSTAETIPVKPVLIVGSGTTVEQIGVR
jgi:hypothetical protein